MDQQCGFVVKIIWWSKFSNRRGSWGFLAEKSVEIFVLVRDRPFAHQMRRNLLSKSYSNLLFEFDIRICNSSRLFGSAHSPTKALQWNWQFVNDWAPLKFSLTDRELDALREKEKFILCFMNLFFPLFLVRSKEFSQSSYDSRTGFTL